jgi:hypothetical protein
MAMGMDDVRDPHKWRKFINRMSDRAAVLAANSRSTLGLLMDLGLAGHKLPEMQATHAAIYKLTRLARGELGDLNRKEIVNIYNSLIHGPSPLKTEAFKILARIDG